MPKVHFLDSDAQVTLALHAKIPERFHEDMLDADELFVSIAGTNQLSSPGWGFPSQIKSNTVN